MQQVGRESGEPDDNDDDDNNGVDDDERQKCDLEEEAGERSAKRETE